jgi:hypothetical protein
MLGKVRLTYANVIATTALIVSLAGGAYVAYAVERNSVRSQHIVNGEVQSRDLANGATIDNARAVNGSKVRQFSWEAPSNTPFQGNKLFTIAGLTVHASCSDGADEMYLRTRTNTNNSIIGVGTVAAKAYDGDEPDAIMFPGVDNDFDAGVDEQNFVELDDTTTVMSYGKGNNSNRVVTATFLANQWLSGGGVCKLAGTVIHGNG